MFCMNWQKRQVLQKTPAPQEISHLKVADPTPQVSNKNGPWVPWQEQNAFIFHKIL